MKGIKGVYDSPEKRAIQNQQFSDYEGTNKKYERLFEARKRIEMERDFFRPSKPLKRPKHMQKYRIRNHFELAALTIQLWWKEHRFVQVTKAASQLK